MKLGYFPQLFLFLGPFNQHPNNKGKDDQLQRSHSLHFWPEVPCFLSNYEIYCEADDDSLYPPLGGGPNIFQIYPPPPIFALSVSAA